MYRRYKRQLKREEGSPTNQASPTGDGAEGKGGRGKSCGSKKKRSRVEQEETAYFDFSDQDDAGSRLGQEVVQMELSDVEEFEDSEQPAQQFSDSEFGGKAVPKADLHIWNGARPVLLCRLAVCVKVFVVGRRGCVA
eukprot:3425063-Rhodomonas_salina.3